jgi:hypothetical protein
LHFADSLKGREQDKEYQKLCKLKEVFNSFNKAYADFCNSSSHVVGGKVIVIFDRKVIFRQYIPSKRKHFGIKIYILCDISGYTNDIRMYLGRDTGTATCDITATHDTVTNLTRKVQDV